MSRQVITRNGETVVTLGFAYKTNSDGTPTNQVGRVAVHSSIYDVSYGYLYDANGNIYRVSDGTNAITYVYDTQNQLLRENNPYIGKSFRYYYDDAGNITQRREYAYTTGTLENYTAIVNYGYGDADWGDLLTSYNGQSITYDGIGNPLNDGTWTYTWEHGRQLASMASADTTVTYTYNADGMRQSKMINGTVYNYVYNGSQLSQMTIGDNVLRFAYDASGLARTVTWNGTVYYYATNLQGDIIAILDADGNAVVEYVYDAWGNIHSTSGTLATTLGYYNPLRYRGYVYDTETGLYYLQSRYYNPEIGRFINADSYASTGQGILGNNMFAYCHNNPILLADNSGTCPHDGRFYTSGPFKGEFEYNPSCRLCAPHGEFWIEDCFGNSYDMTQHDLHEFSQMAICTDGGKDAYNSNSHQNMTAYSINGEYMDPTLVRYVVAPVGYSNVSNGDLALVVDLDSGENYYAIVGDRGPKGKHNEVSLRVAWDLGYEWADGSRGPKGNFLILYFPGTRIAWSSVDELVDFLG